MNVFSSISEKVLPLKKVKEKFCGSKEKIFRTKGKFHEVKGKIRGLKIRWCRSKNRLPKGKCKNIEKPDGFGLFCGYPLYCRQGQERKESALFSR